MPRKGRGGARTGTPGTQYSNRTDLQTQAVRVAPSAQYGQGVQQAAAQKVIPLPDNTSLPAAPPPAQPTPPPQTTNDTPTQGAQGPLPGELGDFNRPTDRPNEPVTTGMAQGAGAGPEALSGSQWNAGDDTGIRLRAMYSKFPNQDLADLIQVFEANRNG